MEPLQKALRVILGKDDEFDPYALRRWIDKQFIEEVSIDYAGRPYEHGYNDALLDVRLEILRRSK